MRVRTMGVLALALSAVIGTALGGLLTFEAFRASRDHRASAERAMRGHARAAVQAYRQQLLSTTYLAMDQVFASVSSWRPGGPPPDLNVLKRAAEAAERCNCGPYARPRYYFRWSRRDDSLVVLGDSIGRGRRRWIADHAQRARQLAEADQLRYLALADSVRMGWEMLYVVVLPDPSGREDRIYGVGVTPAGLRETLLEPLTRLRGLLAIEADSVPAADSVVSVALVDPRGRLVLPITTQQHDSTFTSSLPGGAALGGLHLRLALHPVTASRVLVGGLPPSRVGLLTAVGVLISALLVASLLVASRAVALARTRADFVANVSHELRTPLAQILLFGESLRYERMHTRLEVLRASQVIVDESRRLIQLVENVLLLGRTRRGGAPVRAAIAVAPLVREVVDTFRPLAATRLTSVRIARLDPVSARVDRDEFRQVLLNLLDNALKYGPATQTITVSVARAPGIVRLRVEDEGPGIPLDDRERVWEPFVRLPRELEGDVGGSGIGLAVVRQIVARHGGITRIESSRKRGTAVIVEFPEAPADNTTSADLHAGSAEDDGAAVGEIGNRTNS